MTRHSRSRSASPERIGLMSLSSRGKNHFSDVDAPETERY